MYNSPEDDGIIFVARSNVQGEDRIEITTSSALETPTTTTEATLPWRRKSTIDPLATVNASGSSSSNSGPLKQSEFPSWIENKDYISNYSSPSNTILRRIDNPKYCEKRPTVYEIFTITENLEDHSNPRDEVDNRSNSNNNMNISPHQNDHLPHSSISSPSSPIYSPNNQSTTTITTITASSPPNVVNARINMGFLDDDNQNTYQL